MRDINFNHAEVLTTSDR